MTKLTEAQVKAVKSVDQNVLVAAGAGSGKTSVLVERAIEILRSSPDAKFSQLLAVTYTRKAAAEMQARIKQAVRKLALQTDESAQKEWSRHLSEIDTAKIGTIHSLCESILQSFAFDAEVDPQLEQLDDIARVSLQKQAAKEALRNVINEKTEEHSLLLAYSLDQLETWLNIVLSSPLSYRQAIEKFKDFTEEKLKDFLIDLLRAVQIRIIKQFVNDISFQQIRNALIGLAYTDTQTTIGDVRMQTIDRMTEIERALLDDFVSTDLPSCWETLRLLALEYTRRGKKNDETRHLKDVLKAVRALAEEAIKPDGRFYISPSFDETDVEIWTHTKLLMSLAERTLSIYQKIKSTEGVDYDDLIQMVANTLLQEKSKIKDHYHRSISHILVDEFQDTNLMQANLIKALAGPDTKRFLIGDDKQSIYKFQGAEVALFNQVHSEFQNVGASANKNAVVELSESFRSHPKIVNFFNAVFEKLFIDDTTLAPYHAIYRPLAARAEPIASDQSEHVEIIECQADQAPDLNALEAKTTADWIVQACNKGKPVKEKDGTVRPIKPGDIAVLTTTNDMLVEIEQALAAAEIPYVRLGGRGFLQRQEIYDLENLLAFLHNQNDDHALLGLLRAPFCGIPDDLIHTLFVGQEEHFWKILGQAAKAHKAGHEVIAQTHHLLKRFVQASHFLPVSQLLRKFIQATSYDITLLKTRNGKQRSRNLWKLVQMASQREELSCGEFAAHLRTMRQLRVNEKDAPVDAKNSVKLMTIHASKGLEFPAVILPRLGSPKNAGNRKILFHKDYGLALDNTRLSEQPPPLYYRLAYWLDQDMEAAERRRLLYVAATRARDYLTVIIPATAKAHESTFAGWLKKIILRPGADLDLMPQSSPQVLSVPGTNATFAFRHVDEDWTPLPTLIARPSFEPAIMPVSISTSEPPKPIVPAPRLGVVEQLSIFSLANEPEQETKAESEPGEPKPNPAPAPTSISYSLIEPSLTESRDLKNNTLAAQRISPRQGQVELSPIVVGKYFHALLERLRPGQNECDQTFLRNVALTQGFEVAHKDILDALIGEGGKLLAIYFKSELFQIVKAASERHHELPYMMIFEEKLDTRRPDLLIKKTDQSWHVIDYKTDTFAQSEMARQALQHRKQLDGYAVELSGLVGSKVTPHLYFAQHGMIYSLNR